MISELLDDRVKLINAAYEGNLSAVKEFIVKGVDVNSTIDNDRMESTALMAASKKGHKDIVQLLIDNGVDVLAKIGGRTALMCASEEGYMDIVKLLIDNGAAPIAVGSGICQ